MRDVDDAGRRRPATVAAWESFGNVWIQDAVKQLKLPNLTVLDADYGEIPDLASHPAGRRCRLHLERHDFRREDSEHRLARRRTAKA